MYDFIGDIHGHADELKALLEKLDYKAVDGVYCHPTRKAFFTGDFIDRGPKIRETLQIVKAMIDSGHALTVMGNHEYNAVCYNLPVGDGDYLRKHNIKNKNQHSATLKQFENHQNEYEAYLQWFRTLPLYYDADNFRVVHACWDAGHIAFIDEKLKSNRYRQNGALTDEFFKDASDKTNSFHGIIEETLKGKECRLPEGRFILDKEKNKRHEVRIKWWLKPVSPKWHDWSFHPYAELTDGLVNNALIKSGSYYYGENEKPVFFGHYWCEGQPNLYRDNICCVDYSVNKGNKLAAYRFNGEKQLNNDNLIYVESNESPAVVVEKTEQTVKLPADSCLFCGKTLSEVGGQMIVAQRCRSVKLTNQNLGGGDPAFPMKSAKLPDNSGLFVVVQTEKDKLTPELMERATREFLAERHPWFCQICGQRVCLFCGTPTQMVMASDMIGSDGKTGHQGVFPVNPGCWNEKCKNHRRDDKTQE